jgi:hypothetical protein
MEQEWPGGPEKAGKTFPCGRAPGRLPSTALRSAGFRANLAQLVEQLICNQPVVGSSPTVGFLIFNDFSSRTRTDSVRVPFAAKWLRKSERSDASRTGDRGTNPRVGFLVLYDSQRRARAALLPEPARSPDIHTNSAMGRPPFMTMKFGRPVKSS